MEQFSQKYIDYIRGVKVLQDPHPVGVGEWRVFTTSYKDDRPWIVTKGEEFGLIVEGMYADGSQVSCLYARERSRWLPTLWQLVQIIEGAGYHWSRWFDGSMSMLRCDADGEEYDTVGPTQETDTMLAAAKLAAKALEEA